MWLSDSSSVITDQMFLSLTWHILGPIIKLSGATSLSSTGEVALMCQLAAVTTVAAVTSLSTGKWWCWEI